MGRVRQATLSAAPDVTRSRRVAEAWSGGGSGREVRLCSGKDAGTLTGPGTPHAHSALFFQPLMPQEGFCAGLQVQRPAETRWRGKGARAGRARSPPHPLRLPRAVAPLTRVRATQSPPQAGAEALAPGWARASSRGQDGMPAGLAPANPTAPGICALAPWHVLFLPWPCGLDLCPFADLEVPFTPHRPLLFGPNPIFRFLLPPTPPPPPRRHLISSPRPPQFPGLPCFVHPPPRYPSSRDRPHLPRLSS